MTSAPVLKEREMQGKARQLGREIKNIRLVAAKGRTLSQDELDAKHAPKLAGAPSGLQGRGAVWDPEGGWGGDGDGGSPANMLIEFSV